MHARPRPLAAAATSVSKLLGLAGALVTALAGWGILSVAQGDAVTGLLGAIPGVVTAVTTALAAFGVVRQAEPLVTPLADPMTDDGTALLPRSVETV